MTGVREKLAVFVDKKLRDDIPLEIYDEAVINAYNDLNRLIGTEPLVEGRRP